MQMDKMTCLLKNNDFKFKYCGKFSNLEHFCANRGTSPKMDQSYFKK